MNRSLLIPFFVLALAINGTARGDTDPEVQARKDALNVAAAFSNDAGARVLLDSDPQVLRAIEALPDAKRLAETTRNNSSQG